MIKCELFSHIGICVCVILYRKEHYLSYMESYFPFSLWNGFSTCYSCIVIGILILSNNTYFKCLSIILNLNGDLLLYFFA